MLYPSVNVFVLLPVMLGYTAFMIWLFLRLLNAFKRKELAHQRQLLETKFQAEKELYEAKQEIQEETFKQISRELHDNVGQTFSLAKLGLASLPLDSPAETEATVLELTDILAKGISDLRDISTSINAELVRTTGLTKAIEYQVGFLERTGRYQVSFNCADDIQPLDPSTAVIFYRILQEALNNIIRHSHANEIKIRLSMITNQLQLLIQDNGSGFDPVPVLSAGFRQGGIANMKARATAIGADLQVVSGPGQGTIIRIMSNQII